MPKRTVVRNLPVQVAGPDGAPVPMGLLAVLLEASASTVADELEADGLRVLAVDIRPVDARFALVGFVATFTCECG